MITPRQSGRIRQLMASRSHLLQRFDPVALLLYCRRRQEVCAEGELARYWYYLVSGAAVRCIIRRDGRRQVIDLMLPGDFFAVLSGNEYDSTLEAVSTGTVLAAYPRSMVDREAQSDPELEAELRQIATDTLTRLQRQLLIVCRITVLEKVGSFLLALEQRLSDGTDGIDLPISRYEIADYLAVSVEAVSRALSDLKRRGLIACHGPRQVKIIDRRLLDAGNHDMSFPQLPPARVHSHSETIRAFPESRCSVAPGRPSWSQCDRRE